jgi:serine/threonine-protein kinase RsbW
MEQAIKEDNRIIIPSSLNFLREVDEFVEEKLRSQGVEQGIVTDIAISVTEVVTNAVAHGNQNDPDKKVTVSLKIDKKQVVIRVEDQGHGFDPQHLANPLAEENLLKDAGRGIFIVKSLMDEIKFEISPDSGTAVILIKNL